MRCNSGGDGSTLVSREDSLSSQAPQGVGPNAVGTIGTGIWRTARAVVLEVLSTTFCLPFYPAKTTGTRRKDVFGLQRQKVGDDFAQSH
jgi:hypothetical protein